jgi:putative phosphoesterase
VRRVLVLGDTHVPDRAHSLNPVLKKLIEDQKPWDVVAFTGDLTGEEVLQWVKSLGREVYVVRGNMDYLPLPKTAVFEVEGLKFGVHHGDGVYPRGDTKTLTRIADSLGVDVLLTGHTHADFVKPGTGGKKLLVNPGSLTGVWGGGGGSYTPSFMELVVVPGTLQLVLYKHARGRIEVRKYAITRSGESFTVREL